eukprot:1038242-Amphidinium_carterae.1
MASANTIPRSARQSAPTASGFVESSCQGGTVLGLPLCSRNRGLLRHKPLQLSVGNGVEYGLHGHNRACRKQVEQEGVQ